MPIDPGVALAAEPVVSEFRWSPDDVILYHLGIGAGLGRPTDPRELEYLFEVNLKVLPTFGVVPPFGAMWMLNDFPGMDINLMLVLHGEQEIRLHRPIPIEAEVVNTTRIVGLQDKGRAAVVNIDVETTLQDGTPLFSNLFSVFARGEGGFGGDPGTTMVVEAPDRAPDAVVLSPTMPHQALIYRLSGDKNPLHADPTFARMAGFETPILHGLSSYGAVCKAVVDEVLDGDVRRVDGFRTRFSGVVYPGETIVTSMWETADGVVITATTEERAEPVLTNCLLTIKE
jgi:acyl dehydratase